MRMIPKIKTVVAKALTDPKPQFVSLVTAGANMTPFAVTKSDPAAEGKSIMSARTRKRSITADLNDKFGHTLSTVRKLDGFAVARIEFARGGEFADVEAVKSWLEAGGYADYELETNMSDNVIAGWTVTSKTEFDGSAKAVKAAKDVVVHVAKIKTEAPVASAEETVAKTEETPAAEGTEAPAAEADASAGESVEPAQKGDDTGAAAATEAVATQTEATTGDLNPVAKSDEAPAEGEVQTQKSTYQVCEMADVVRSLSWLVSDARWEAEYNEGSEETVAKLKALAAEALKVLADLATAEAAVLTQKSEAVAPAETNTAKTEETPAPAAAPQVDVASIVAAAVSPLAEAVAAVAKSLEGVVQKMDKQSEDVTARVQALESRAQTRKGADVEEISTTPAPTTPKSKAAQDDAEFIDSLSRRSALGLRGR